MCQVQRADINQQLKIGMKLNNNKKLKVIFLRKELKIEVRES